MRTIAVPCALLACSLALSAQTTSQTTSQTTRPTPSKATRSATHRVHHRAAAGAVTEAKTPACPPTVAAPFTPPDLPPAPGSVQTAFALRYVEMQVGTGEAVTPGEFLTVQYTGYLASNGTKFDSSLDRSEPFTFLQGAHRVIPGWDQGFGGMRVGGKRRFFIPYQLAYGDQGRPPVIPPASDLIFDIELVAASPNPPGVPPTPPPPPAPPAPPQPPAPQR